ncbi:mycothiol synthase [Actinomadura bangladeshensis]|uniref:Mycothiol acetyltransferase n=1 Tax=Actinomadura bangladeshensis TaxID=453573 RepID=A0A4V2XL41_9ACTN|nr:mycothiol synthase [Actinomadura bangladeshensis]TDC08886.1 mycothiol synthase [Actinomadura bangladeshensis]
MSELRARGTLGKDEVAEALALADAAERSDGVGPLSEHAVLALRGGRPGLAVSDGGAIVAYAHFDPASETEPAAGELVVHPDHRRRGHGRALLRALRDEAGGPLRVWAHGDLPAAAALAGSEGMARVRALFQLRRPASDPLPETRVPDGVSLRTFEPGRDERAWLDVNARAFADHPEQGAWTMDDVREREAEDWFDPSGFFLAERDGRLAGFHWTKVHPGKIGEVYVVGVDPDAQGLGLGRTLTLRGLHHLRDTGMDQIMLYVDESNVAAVRLYESLGFTRYAVDVMYA